jgi:AGZA family xanthine/uracil permease-like MFS transporter
MGLNGWIHNANMAVARSLVGRRFRLDGSGHPRERKGTYFFTEIRAGLATFFAMAYIISVNATIVSQSGGTCVCPPDSPDLCDSDPDYMLCVAGIQRDLVTATAAISALTTFCMGLFANMPIALAPGMGLNAYVSCFSSKGYDRDARTFCRGYNAGFLIICSLPTLSLDTTDPALFHTKSLLQQSLSKGSSSSA